MGSDGKAKWHVEISQTAFVVEKESGGFQTDERSFHKKKTLCLIMRNCRENGHANFARYRSMEKNRVNGRWCGNCMSQTRLYNNKF